MNCSVAVRLVLGASVALAACAGSATDVADDEAPDATASTPSSTRVHSGPTTPVAPPGSASSTTINDQASALLPADADPPLFDVVVGEAELFDSVRDRRIPYRTYAPRGHDAAAPLVLVSHGGRGSDRGHRSGEHIGSALAAAGLVAVHIGHTLPAEGRSPNVERPADVTVVLDALEDGLLTLPAEFDGTVDIDRVGHVGHSWGAYTAHAVAGADFGAPFADPRIDAIAPISPQGADQFGGFDRGPDDNTWIAMHLPALNLVGGAEMDSNVTGSIDRDGWRREPFDRYPDTSDTFLVVVDGQDHGQMWGRGSAEIQSFVADSIVDFMRVYVAGDVRVDPCDIGNVASLAMLERRPAAEGSSLGACP